MSWCDLDLTFDLNVVTLTYKILSGPVFTNILILRIRIFLEFFLENSKNKFLLR